MSEVSTLLDLCVQKLAQNLIKYGPKRVRFTQLSELPRRALEALLDILVAKNALNDNVLPYAITRQTQKLGLEGASQLRRCVLNTIGRSCPNLRLLDVRTCQQIDNRIVRDVLQYCEHLEILRVDGCTRISDSAFAPALWKPPLAGLLNLRELSLGKCGQVTAEGLLTYVIKGAPYLRTLGLAFCRLTITDEVAAELLFQFGLQSLDLSHCTQISDSPFQAYPRSMLRELRLSNTNVTDAAIQTIAARSPMLEVFDGGWVIRLSDPSVFALVQHCSKLRNVSVCSTQITDASFQDLVRCNHLERLDASWCLKASPRAIDILWESPSQRPPLRELVLDRLGAFGTFDIEPVGSTSPHLLWDVPKGISSTCTSPLPLNWFPMRLPPEPPSLLLPPAATSSNVPGLTYSNTGQNGTEEDQQGSSKSNYHASPAGSLIIRTRSTPTTPPSLKDLVKAYGATLQQLLLDGLRDIAEATALEAIASCCPTLQQLALTLTSTPDEAARASLHSIGERCSQLSVLRIDSSARPHEVVVAALALPSFGHLRSLTIWCCSKGLGLQDAELETILVGRRDLETLILRNCDGLSESLFPRWCNRCERHEADAVLMEQLDQALFSSLHLSPGASSCSYDNPMPPGQDQSLRRRKKNSQHPAALAMRSVTSFSLSNASALSDRSADALAEILHDVQSVELRGCPHLTEDALRSFRKGCRFIRSVSVVMRERTLQWTALTSQVKKQRHRRRSSFYSGSSGTESN